MYKKYGKQAEFYLVYIREAHPTDGRQSRGNSQEKILFLQPKTFTERSDIATKMCTKLKIAMPCLIDGLDNKVGNNYSAMPDRIYVVGVDGKIIYKGARGPRGFKPKEAVAVLEKYLPTLAKQSDSVSEKKNKDDTK